MEKLFFEYPADKPARNLAMAGVVASGDLEVLLEPHDRNTVSVSISTSVEGKSRIWQALLERLFTATPMPAAKLEINDSGATPGVVRLRIEQAFEESGRESSRGLGQEYGRTNTANGK